MTCKEIDWICKRLKFDSARLEDFSENEKKKIIEFLICLSKKWDGCIKACEHNDCSS